MGTLKRTQENFPKMRVRGGVRRHYKRKPRDIVKAINNFTLVVNQALEVMIDFHNRVGKLLTSKDEYVKGA